jgi:hypothetical protein
MECQSKMAWARIEDRAHSNPKLHDAGLAGAGLYFMALSYCAGEMTDGYVPRSWVKKMGTPTVIAKVTAAKLWQSVEEGEVVETVEEKKTRTSRELVPVLVTMPSAGYFIRDYVTLNGSKRTIQAKRETEAERLRQARKDRQDDVPA